MKRGARERAWVLTHAPATRPGIVYPEGVVFAPTKRAAAAQWRTEGFERKGLRVRRERGLDRVAHADHDAQKRAMWDLGYVVHCDGYPCVQGFHFGTSKSLHPRGVWSGHRVYCSPESMARTENARAEKVGLMRGFVFALKERYPKLTPCESYGYTPHARAFIPIVRVDHVWFRLDPRTALAYVDGFDDAPEASQIRTTLDAAGYGHVAVAESARPERES